MPHDFVPVLFKETRCNGSKKGNNKKNWLKEKTFLSIPNPFSFSPAAVEVEDTSNPVFGKETPLIIKLTVHYKSLRQSKI